MKYTENQEKFYTSDFAAQIADHWVTGIPFFMEEGSAFYDAFLFFARDAKASRFEAVKMLVLLDVDSGEIKEMTEQLEPFALGTEFSFTAVSFSTVDEYLALQDELCEAYEGLRNSLVEGHDVDGERLTKYLSLVAKTVPGELVERVYKPLSPKLFATW